MSLRCSSPGALRPVAIGLDWLDSGDTLNAAPTLSSASDPGITVENISRPASTLTKGEATYEQNKWFQFDLVVASGLTETSKQIVIFTITTTKTEAQDIEVPITIQRPKAS